MPSLTQVSRRRHYANIAPVAQDGRARYARRACTQSGIIVGDDKRNRISFVVRSSSIGGRESVAMEGKDELLQCLEVKIASGHSMVDRLRLMGKIDGIDKLIRKIQQEIKFLEKVSYTCLTT